MQSALGYIYNIKHQSNLPFAMRDANVFNLSRPVFHINATVWQKPFALVAS